MRATPSPTRRSLVAQAGLAAIAATSVPLASAAANPDAVLIDMVAALAAANDRQRAHSIVVSDGMNRCMYPDPPRELCFRASDWPAICANPEHHCELRTFDAGEDKRVYNDRSALTPEAEKVWSAGGVLVGSVLSQAEQVRVLEIRAAFECWQADIAFAEHEAGMTEPVRMFELQDDIIKELQLKITSTPARTAEGLVAKGLAAAIARSAPVEVLEKDIASLIGGKRDFAALREMASLSFMIDAVKMTSGRSGESAGVPTAT